MASTAQILITEVAGELTSALAEIGWNVLIARGELSAIECLYRQGNQGLAVVRWQGATPLQQSRTSLVARHRFVITLSARRPLGEDALGQLQGNPNDTSLLLATDIARSAIRKMEIPARLRPSPQDVCPDFVGESPLSLPENFPADGIEQSWTATLADLDLDETT